VLELSARKRIILSIDTSDEKQAEQLIKLAKESGARFIKLGLEFQSATSWRRCSEMAGENSIEWVADAKIHDISNTSQKIMQNISGLPYPPFGITMHTTAGQEAMRLAQKEVGKINVLGVTVLTSIAAEEVEHIYHVPVDQKVMELAEDAAQAKLAGIVASAQEVGMIKKNPKTSHLITMIPGTRSLTAQKGDQARVATPEEAIRDQADLLVIGRQVTEAADPKREFEALVSEIESALKQEVI